VRELTTEFEGNFSQLAELRVEQVTEKERKRIAADLHDDLGAKLLTIVHTSESERISALAREALEDMRLSVKGLIGKPMRLADALADWRAETVARLSQSKVEVDWLSPIEETEHLLPSRGFVQTTRIVREAVSNIIKHSRATRCSVRCRIADGYFRDDDPGQRPRHSDGARRQARRRARHVEHEAARQADARPMPGSVRSRLRDRDRVDSSALNRRAPGAQSTGPLLRYFSRAHGAPSPGAPA
jgi:hypothetical protein